MKANINKWAVPALAVFGLAVSTYLAVLHFIGGLPPCLGYAGCAEVNTSVYAEIYGIPVAALGAVLYLGLLSVGLVRLRLRGLLWGQATLAFYGMTVAGAAFMAYLTGIEFLVLHAVCYWCLALALTTLLLLILATRDVWAFGLRGAPAF